ncbi:ORF166 [White spot syndrome virus]|uniref:ORF166 n=1 Tax=White spot syndrome virus TaxID=342409 RepID=Q91L86_9VIRU|nr:ORF166 [White spot syndrome virus]
MFKANVLNLGGGKFLESDVRDHLIKCANQMKEEPTTLRICLSNKLPEYDNRRLPLLLLNEGEQILVTDNLTKNGNPLVKQMGHLAVQDRVGGDGSVNPNNLLYAGCNVVEYDTVNRGNDGKLIMYSQPATLKDVAKSKKKGMYKVKKVPEITGDQFLDKLNERSCKNENRRMDEEGPHVGTGKLLRELIIMMRLYEEETSSAEKLCVTPAFREFLGCGRTATDVPVFKVAFITNASLMGLKVIFYPTILEEERLAAVSDTENVVLLKSILKVQLELLSECMPRIVERVESMIKKTVACFKIDIGGSDNWNLPGHCKVSDTAFPYHHAQLVGEKKNILSISNENMVTSLGVVKADRAEEWMCKTLESFEKKCLYLENLMGSMANTDDWRRKILFSELGPEMPYRNKSLIMDQDFCTIGMCYKFLAEGGGLLLTKTNATLLKEKMACKGLDDSGDGDDEEEDNEEGGSGGKSGGGSGDENNINKPPPAPKQIPPLAANVYNSIINDDDKLDQIVCFFKRKHGFFLSDIDNSPLLAMEFLLPQKAMSKKNCVERVKPETKNIIRNLTGVNTIKFDTIMPFAILQIVVRYENRNLKLPRDTDILQQRLKNNTWDALSKGKFAEMWQFTHKESLKPPTIEELESIPPPPTQSEEEAAAAAAASTSSTTPDMVSSLEEGATSTSSSDENQIASLENIKKLLSIITSTFATGADKNDTIFAWTVVTLAERFCALYNITSHPEEYYQQIIREDFEFEGGFEKFRHMCDAINRELSIYVPKSVLEKQSVCRMGVAAYENSMERIKNKTNSKLCKIKYDESTMVYELNNDTFKTFDYDESDKSFGPMYECAPMETFQRLFASVKSDKEAVLADKKSEKREKLYQQKQEYLRKCDNDDVSARQILNNVASNESDEESDEESDDEENYGAAKGGATGDYYGGDDEDDCYGFLGEFGSSDDENVPSDNASSINNVQDDVFRDVNFIKTFNFRSSLCHRQKYVSTVIVEEMEKNLCDVLTLDNSAAESGDILKEINRRSLRMRNWVVPFTMPVREIVKPNVNSEDGTANSNNNIPPFCSCASLNNFKSDSPLSSNNTMSNEKCIKLLPIPSSKHLKDLTVALRFNTMACERRYFSDVTAALGFVKKDKVNGNIRSILDNKRWDAIKQCKLAGKCLSSALPLGIYENVISEDNKLINTFRPRSLARLACSSGGDGVSDKSVNNGFFSGIWALCANQDLESVVLGSTVVDPLKPTKVFNQSLSEKELKEKRQQMCLDAANYFKDHNVSKLNIYECFKMMEECIMRTALNGKTSNDSEFFSNLITRYGSGTNSPASRLWTILETVRECFNNSLPIDWGSLVKDWDGSDMLNLKAGVSNVDESGAVFELSEFLGVSARAFFGKDLDTNLDADTWECLLNDDNKDWKAQVAKAYEFALKDNDIRSVENFINSSNLLTNNNVIKKLKIKPTPSNDVRHQIWVEDEYYPRNKSTLRSRAEWMAATEEVLKTEMSLSCVLAMVAMYRIMMQGESVREIATAPLRLSVDKMVPLIRCFKITSKWCSCTGKGDSPKKADASIKEGRFYDIEEDPLHFYRFAAYVIGQVASNDIVIEEMTRKILMSFDFNGFDTSNWLQFITYRFSHVLMGRRSRLLSRPLSLVKNLVSVSSLADKNSEKSNDMYEKRVGKVMKRIARLVLVKAADSVRASSNDLLDCCILDVNDVSVKSLDEFRAKTRQELQETRIDTNYNLVSNSCTTAQLAAVEKSSRIINTNISFHNIPAGQAKVMDANEEAFIDPSLEEINKEDNSGAKQMTGKGGSNRGRSKKSGGGGFNNAGGFYNGDSSRGSSSVVDEDSRSRTGFSQIHMDARNEEDRESGLFSYDGYVLNRIKNMITQNQINNDIVKVISDIENFFKICVPFSKKEYALYGVTETALSAGMDAIERWNKAVEEETNKIRKECRDLTDTGSVYDMNIICPGDYMSSVGEGGNGGCGGGSSSSGHLLSNNNNEANQTNEISEDQLKHEGSDCSFWFNFYKKVVNSSEKKQGKGSVLANTGHEGRIVGRPLRTFIQYKGKGFAETKVLTRYFSNHISDSYWSQVMPICYIKNMALGDEDKSKKKFGKRPWKNFNNNSNSSSNSSVKYVSIQDLEKKDSLKNVPMGYDEDLLSLYDDSLTTSTEKLENIKIVNDSKDAYVILGSSNQSSFDQTFSQQYFTHQKISNINTYKSLGKMWNCNNGMSPKNQIVLLKKLLFKNLNILWIKLYERHISVLCNWGCIHPNSSKNSHFEMTKNNAPCGVTDSNPPLSVYHSGFLSVEDYGQLLKDTFPLMNLHRTFSAKSKDNNSSDPSPEKISAS